MTSIERSSSVQLVYERTRLAILDGSLPPGMQLRIKSLADQNGVSLIPVREALRMLAADALIEVVPNHGARVALLSFEDMLDIYQTRIVLEIEALRQAAPNLTEPDLDRADQLLLEFIRAVEESDVNAYDIHRDLHFLLYQASNSRWLLRLITIMWNHTERYRRRSIPQVNTQTIFEEHSAIIIALRSGDVNQACTALKTHLDNTVRFHAAAAQD